MLAGTSAINKIEKSRKIHVYIVKREMIFSRKTGVIFYADGCGCGAKTGGIREYGFLSYWPFKMNVVGSDAAVEQSESANFREFMWIALFLI